MTRQTSTTSKMTAQMTPLKLLVGLGCLASASIALLPLVSRAMVIEGRIVCHHDRPCIEAAATEGDSIQLRWRNPVSYDFYKVRWSRPGKDETDVQLAGGQSGSLAVSGVVPNTSYTFKLQGCNGQVIGGPVCSEWEVQEIVTGEGVATTQPTPEEAPASESASPPPAAPSSAEAKPESSPPSSAPANAAPLNSPPLEPAATTPTAPSGDQPSGAAPAPDAPAHVVPINP